MSDLATAPATTSAPFVVDGMAPDAVARPASVPELQEAMREALRDQRAVIPVGTAGRLNLGNVPLRYHTAMSTGALGEVIAYEPADMTVTLQAGARIADVQRMLAERGQFLPIDEAGATGSVGGLLAANASGALRHRYGTSRDWLIGLRVVHADGATSKSGGRVVKNVSGYDLHKVHIGAIGTLAVIAEATFKLAPLPKSDMSAIIMCPTPNGAVAIIKECHERGLSLIAAELLSPTAAHAIGQASAWAALLRVAGGSAAVKRTLRDLADLASLADAELEEVDAAVWGRWSLAFAPEEFALRISVTPSRVSDVAEALDRRFAGSRVRVSSTVTAGTVRVRLTPESDAHALLLLGQVTQIAEGRDGHVVVDAAPLAVKRAVDVFGAARSDSGITRRLKAEFDPTGVLAPGRFMGRL